MLKAPVSDAEKWVFSFFVVLLYAATLYQYYVGNQIAIVERGGDPFAHAEWLMSFAGGPVRRGFGGEFVFFLSDTLGVNALSVITAIQMCLLLALIAVLLFTLLRLDRAPLVILLLANPAFAIFWFFEFRVHGKDFLACLCFAPLMLAAFGSISARAGMIFSAALFLISSLLHEATVFFAPALCLSVVALFHGNLRHGSAYWFASGIAVFCGATLAFAMIFATADARMICDAIIDRGLSPALCRSHIAFNAVSTRDTIDHVLGLLDQRPWPTLVLTFILGYLPVFMAIRRDASYLRLALFTLIGAAAFAPLYIIALDYGRWLNMQIAAVTLMLLIGASAGWIKSITQPLERQAFYLLFLLGLTWNITLIQGGIDGGIVAAIARLLS